MSSEIRYLALTEEQFLALREEVLNEHGCWDAYGMNLARNVVDCNWFDLPRGYISFPEGD
jgi:hypothetical protein